MKNYEAFQNRDLRPTWLDKSWQVLWNWNDHNKIMESALIQMRLPPTAMLIRSRPFPLGMGVC